MINANDGEGTLFDAETALNLGFVDEIVKTGKNKVEGVKNSFELYNMFNSIINQTDKMEKVTQLLDLSNEVDENAIVAAIEGIKESAKEEIIKAENEAVTALADLENVTNELNDLKAKIEASNKSRAEDLISKGIEDGKISNDETIKAHWMNQALTDEGFEIVKNMFDSIKTSSHADITNVITDTVIVDNKSKDWDLIDWQKKDPSGLAKMKNENAELYNELYQSTYKTTK
jgi:enoyl-CoA hydratase/carnithine racemase